MDVDESVEEIGLRVGDLVVPMDSEEFLFSSAFGMDADPIECCWSSGPGVVIGVEDFVPPRGYTRVHIVMGGSIGWTYSDYVRVIGRCE
jgi:hypothetical protein